jgi:hypothetical protein
MTAKQLKQLIIQTESFIECWKQFNHFINVGRSKKIGGEDEHHFLELKSLMVQDMETIFSGMEVPSPSKDEILTLISHAPSLRSLSELNEGELRGLENHWHKIYIGWHSILGQLKVKQREAESKGWFRRK